MKYDFTFDVYGFVSWFDTEHGIDGYDVYHLEDGEYMGEIPFYEYFDDDDELDEDKLTDALRNEGLWC